MARLADIAEAGGKIFGRGAAGKASKGADIGVGAAKGVGGGAGLFGAYKLFGGGPNASSESSAMSSQNAGRGTLASVARSGASGSGSLPALRSSTSPSVSDTMSTNKILVQAVRYLASIDAALKNQVEFQRFEYTQAHNAQKEIAAESGKSLETSGSPIGSALTGVKEEVGGYLEKFAKLFGGALLALVAAQTVKDVPSKLDDPEKKKEIYQNISTAGVLAGMAVTGGKLYKGIKTAQSVGKAISGIEGMVKPAQTVAKTIPPVWAKTAGGIILPGRMVENVAETATKVLPKVAGKAGEKALMKGISKGAVLGLVKKIPGIGFLVGLGLAGIRFMNGDHIGAGMELVSAIASQLGPIGWAASLGVDATLLAKDLGVFGDKAKAGNLGGGSSGVNPKNTASSGSLRYPISAGTDVYENIQKAEGTFGKDAYNTSLGYVDPRNPETSPGWKGPRKAVSEMTMAESMEWGEYLASTVGKDKEGRGRAYSSSAKGAFQVVNQTQREAMADLKIKDTDIFSEQNQKRIADWIIANPNQGFKAWEGFKKHPELLQAAKKNYKESKNLSKAADIPTRDAMLAALAPPPMTPRNGVSPTGRSAQAPANVQVNNVSAPQQQSKSGKVPSPHHSGFDWLKYFNAVNAGASGG